MNRKLIDWLLEVDPYSVRSVLGTPKQKESEGDEAPTGDGEATIAAAAATRQSGGRVWVLLFALLLIAAGGFVALAPTAWLGPATAWTEPLRAQAAPLRANLLHSLGLHPDKDIEAAPHGRVQPPPSPATTAVTTPVTTVAAAAITAAQATTIASTAATASTGAVAQSVTATTTARRQAQPARTPDEPQTATATPNIADASAPTPTRRWWIQTQAVPADATPDNLVLPDGVTMSTESTTEVRAGRIVVGMETLPATDAATIADTLVQKGLPAIAEAADNDQARIKIGPFDTRAAADDAAMQLLEQDIPPQVRDASIEQSITRWRIGPFERRGNAQTFLDDALRSRNVDGELTETESTP